MNRVWPGDDDGTLHERMAARLWELAVDADAIVDLHTGSPNMYPHVVFRQGTNARVSWRRRSAPICCSRNRPTTTRPRSGTDESSTGSSELPQPTRDSVDHSRTRVQQTDRRGRRRIGRRGPAKRPSVTRDAPRNGDEARPDDRTEPPRKAQCGRIRPVSSGALADGRNSSRRGRPSRNRLRSDDVRTLHDAVADRSGILYALTHEATVTAGDQLASVAVIREDSSNRGR